MMPTDLTGRFRADVHDKMFADIEECDGNEVLWVGTIDEDKVVSAVKTAARGHESAVPAVMEHMEKGDVIIHNHPSGILRPSDADLTQASMLGNQGIGFYIVNNSIDAVYVVVEPVLYSPDVLLDEKELSGILAPGGPLDEIDPYYEERPCQIELLETITRGFNEEKIVVAEAGTGVGKSFSYLVPALKWADANEQRVVISTATINLQQQLMEKDLPLAQKLCGTDVKAVLVKGRRNYLCRNRLSEALEENSLFREKSDLLLQIKDWGESSPTGSISELPFLPPDEIWSRVCSDADACFGARCRYFENCFVMKSRREAAAAGILVVNHHMYFADMSLRISGLGFEGTVLLPHYHKVIFDEAHNIENSATSYFSEEYNRIQLMKYLQRLYKQRKGRSGGILIRLEAIQPPPEGVLFPELLRDLRAQAEILDALAFDFFPGESTVRLQDNSHPDYLRKIREPLLLTREKLSQFIGFLNKWYDLIREEDQENTVVLEFKMILNRLNKYSVFLNKFSQFDAEDEDGVFWLEKKVRDGKSFIRFLITPLDISGWMKSGIYDSYSSVVFTSATLTMDNKFSYWQRRVGLDQQISERLVSRQFASPFPYKENVLLGLPEDIPEPSAPEYREVLMQSIRKLLQSNEGRALVLFTSYELLKYCYDNILEDWSLPEVSLLRQGSEDRARLLNHFTQDIQSVLFATDSFWEGVDTPGESLRLVILCKLPFRVPTDPVYQARLEAIEKRGGNPFRELSLPEAVMKFRQGFGRLMRRKTDRGAVIVLDSRVINKNYGTVFLRSLPETLRSRKRFDTVLEDMENFIYEI
ncbi:MULTISPECIES: helicase C-terminal domain-containing protein [unclassified Oceanispirochaeta]|uniref:helicase C-terminal domain-containing protein n=1 Tax=unclassified Oceanispirochaeta TaxID=2635722 RepID=UPI0013144C17|nr:MULTISPECIES: helicase C-terminal domain-containing protein [unclassified Oceanispirochaeta]MBF9018665.1 helicase c2 [Oceanispirochaeta sp. M2]NPD75102.1 helicase c2 [Oceanispirochaeta sp. M1]